ncbi:hypothetical protein D3C77_445550 [compost metagenome]
MAVLPVTMRGLIQVHKIHVDRFPWNITVKLGMEMQQRLLQLGQAANPHFCR